MKAHGRDTVTVNRIAVGQSESNFSCPITEQFFAKGYLEFSYYRAAATEKDEAGRVLSRNILSVRTSELTETVRLGDVVRSARTSNHYCYFIVPTPEDKRQKLLVIVVIFKRIKPRKSSSFFQPQGRMSCRAPQYVHTNNLSPSPQSKTTTDSRSRGRINPKKLAAALACSVTVPSSDDDWVARKGNDSLFALLQTLLPEVM